MDSMTPYQLARLPSGSGWDAPLEQRRASPCVRAAGSPFTAARMGTVILLLALLLSACVPPTATPTPTPTAEPPTVTPSATPPQSPLVTPTPETSPLVTPTPPASPLATPDTDIGRPLLVRSSTIISNVLVNGGFNLPYVGMPGYSTIQLPQGWSFGWLQHPACTHNDPPGCSPVIPCPTNCLVKTPVPPGVPASGDCSNDEGCYWAMPEATRVLSVEFSGLRTREGNASAKVFTVGRMGSYWYYQTAEVGAGNVVTFSAYMQAWMCLDFANCSKGQRSDKPAAMHLQVGIDPTGGKVVTSTNVLWSAEGDAFRIDKNSPNIWRLFTVTAVSRARNVTVFIRATTDWSLPALDFPALYDGNYARQNNDLYIDQSSLSVRVLNPIHRGYLPMVRR